MSERPLTILLDVDNTLLDNDAVIADLGRFLDEALGPAARDHYWQAFETLRTALGYADYLGTLQQVRAERPRDPHYQRISRYLLNYPFETRLFPRVGAAIAHLQRFGDTVILSDGDVVFQPLKVERSGLLRATRTEPLIYIHKELELDDVVERLPSAHYTLVDDKLRILTACKQRLGARLTTVFVRQGHYARDAKETAKYPAADVTIERIGDLLDLDGAALQR